MTSESAENLARFAGQHAVLLLFLLLSILGVASLLLIFLVRVMKQEGRRSATWLTAGGYLPIHIIVGLLGSLAAVLFVLLARQIAGESVIARFDSALAEALYSSTSPFGREVFSTITFFGSFPAHASLGAAVALFLVGKRPRTLLIGWAVCLVGTQLLIWLLKAVFERQRPEVGGMVQTLGWSFPSGHALSTLALWGMLAYLLLLFVRSAPARITIGATAAAWTLLVGFSRMYLGVHYLSDVVAGYAAGTVWLATCISVVELSRRRSTRRSGQQAGS